MALRAIPQSLAVSRADGDYGIIFISPGFELLTGYAAEEVHGRNCRFLAGPGTSPHERAQMRAALSDRVPYSGRVLNYRKDGSAFWNEISLHPVVHNGIEYVVGLQNDVTERLDVELKLQEAQRMEAVGKLSGGIAHDFNNVLALILSNAELIVGEAPENSLIADAARDIVEAAEGGSKLIGRLLQYARGEGHNVEDVPLNALIEDVAALVSRSISESVKVEVDLSPAVGNVRVDRTLLNTSLINLLLNSRDAIENGGTVRIATRRRSNAGRALGTVAVLTVTDDGSGMDAETLARVFEPFFTTKALGRGNGLGLPMVYNFVQQSGGEISVESEPGAGTVVTILLPMEEPPVRTVEYAEGQRRALVVEDEDKVRKVVSLQLSRAGYLVDEVASAEEALALIASGAEPDVLLSDIRLRHGMSGTDLLRELRGRNAPIAMVLMTGNADDLDLDRIGLGDVPVIGKPFRNADLLGRIEEAIAQAGRGHR